MIRQTLRRILRSPVPALAVLLFAAALSAVLCGLQRANDLEQQRYEETLQTIPVHAVMTNLTGTSFVDLEIPWDLAEVFVDPDALGKYVTDLQMVCKYGLSGQFYNKTLVGITSTALSPELWPENGTYIQWKEGYDESIFAGTDSTESDLVCLVPQSVAEKLEGGGEESFIDVEFVGLHHISRKEYSFRMKVIGTYWGDDRYIYCPFDVCHRVYQKLDGYLVVESFRATLKDNKKLEEFRAASKEWFAEPNPFGEKTPCNLFTYTSFPYALTIKDELLQTAAKALRNRILTNRVCTVIVQCLSAAAGFLIGYLMIRTRKREIALMRALGTSGFRIYFGFALEQMVCYGLGIAAGGIVNLWNPAHRLGILAAIYFAGLSVSLVVMLRKNLLTTVKEDE